MPQTRKPTNQPAVARARAAASIERCHPNAAGIDVGAREHWVAVPGDRAAEPVRHFRCFTSDLHRLADWLAECGVDTVAMESTGVYWVPLYEILEERGFEVFLVNSEHVHNVPGRKSDVLDCQWLQQLHSFGLLHRSFRPSAAIAELRIYVRQREMLVQGAADYVRRMQKALDLMNIHLHKIVSDITGETGMRIVRTLLNGTLDPEKLATHRDYRCRASQAEIAESLRGNFRAEHLFALRQAVALYDAHIEQLAACDAQIQKTLDALAANSEPLEIPARRRKLQRAKGKQPTFEIRDPLSRITGVDLTEIHAIAPLTALNILAEIGTDMSRWPTVKHFSSWLNLAPGTQITGGKRLSGRRRFATNRVANLLRLAAVTAGRTNTAIGAFYRRMAARLGKAKAVVATAHKLARLIYTILKNRTAFQDPGADAYEQRYRRRVESNLRRRAAAFGFQLIPLDPPPTELPELTVT